MDAEYADTLRQRMAADMSKTLVTANVDRVYDEEAFDAILDQLVDDGMHAVEQTIARTLSD